MNERNLTVRTECSQGEASKSDSDERRYEPIDK